MSVVHLPISVEGHVAGWLSRHPEEGETVRLFVARMVTELAANDDKGNRPGWLTMDRKTAIAEVHWHASKLAVEAKRMEALETSPITCNDGEMIGESQEIIREYAADVANCALMVLDCMRLLGDLPEPPAPFDPEQIAPHIHDGRESL